MSPKKLAEYETECINVTYFKVFWLIPAALCWGCYNTTHLSLLSCTHPPHQPLMQFVVSKISTPSKNTSLCLISLWHKDSLWHFCEGHFSKSKTKTKKKANECGILRKGPWCSARSTAYTFTKVIVSQLHAALWCFACGVLGDLMQSTQRRARRRMLDLDSCCRYASEPASRTQMPIRHRRDLHLTHLGT